MGKYSVHVGCSSEDLPLLADFAISGDYHLENDK
jgi:hypothetical protein